MVCTDSKKNKEPSGISTFDPKEDLGASGHRATAYFDPGDSYLLNLYLATTCLI